MEYIRFAAASFVALGLGSSAFAATVTLYDQDFETPANFVNNGGDVNISRA